MIPVDEPLPPIAVIVSTPSAPRYTLFELSSVGVWVPSQSSYVRLQGRDVVDNLNQGIRTSAPEAGFYWFLDDDTKFPAQTALRLAKHNKPVVVPLSAVAFPPFNPTIYKSKDARSGEYVPYQWSELDSRSGLHVVLACNRSGMLVRRDVIDALGDPWFQPGGADDLDFCRRVQEKGFEITVDLDTVLGQIAPCVVSPTMDAYGRWVMKFEWNDYQGFTMSRA